MHWRMSRRKIRDIRHDEFIEATITAVAAHGYGVVTMSEIAAEAGSTAASISYYFGSKENLMEATMRQLLTELRAAILGRFSEAKGPRARLDAIIEANFDDRLFTTQRCSVWVQFWASAPYSDSLARLHRINRSRVQSHVRAELRHLLPQAQRETVRETLQAYMDGVWLDASQSQGPVDARTKRTEAKQVVALMLGH
jgi:TetR/AcrR family transcriptional repressor of bet genes